MNIHEYQAKQLLAGFGVPILKGGVAYGADNAAYVAAQLGRGPLGRLGANTTPVGDEASP
jgi:succinyl-CoA synthetase beta subunit